MSAVRMRMSRAFRLACSALILLAGAAAAEPLSTAMREVERLRGLTFVHDVAQRTVNRDDLRALLRAEVVKSFPYAPEQYVEILSAFQLVDTRSPELIDTLLDLYQSQVLAFYDPRSHTYFAVRELPAAVTGLGDPELLQQSVVVHELVHAFGMPHRCGYFDFTTPRRPTCCMNYSDTWMADAQHNLIPGTEDKCSPNMCGLHLKEVRRVRLQMNKALAWK